MAFERVMGPSPVAPTPALTRTPGPTQGSDASPDAIRPEDLLQLEREGLVTRRSAKFDTGELAGAAFHNGPMIYCKQK